MILQLKQYLSEPLTQTKIRKMHDVLLISTLCRSTHCYTYNSSIFHIVAVDDKAAVTFSSIIDAIKSITVNHTIAKCLN